MSFKLKFWGVRGSVACPGPRHVVFGGNTSCIEISIGGERFILDGGTGVRMLGHWMLKKQARRATILLSHTHWDHINGLPFFSPAFHKDCSFHILAGHLIDHGGVSSVFAGQMRNPYFPVPVAAMNARLTFEDFRAGDELDVGRRRSFTLRTAPLNHPSGATGYRFDHKGRSVCYITDTEHVPGKLDENVAGLVQGADLLIYDSTYTDEEFPAKVGWGHSTWQEAIRMAKAAEVKNVAIFHHDPDHDDSFMKDVERQARAEFAGAFVAREGMRLDIEKIEDLHD